MRRVLTILIAAMMIISIPGAAMALGLEVAVGGWAQSPSGTIGYKPINLDDEIDLERDMGYEKETRVFGRAKLDLPAFIPNIYVMYTPMEFEADGTKTIDFNFGGTTFSAGADFHSKVSLNHYDIALYYGIPFLKTATTGVLNVELGLNAKVINFDASITGHEIGDTDPNNTVTVSKSLTVPLPMLYVGAQIKPIKYVAVELEGRGANYSGNHFYDFIGRVKGKPFGPVLVAVGYRVEDVKIDEQGVIAEIKFSGPFIEAGLEF